MVKHSPRRQGATLVLVCVSPAFCSFMKKGFLASCLSPLFQQLFPSPSPPPYPVTDRQRPVVAEQDFLIAVFFHACVSSETVNPFFPDRLTSLGSGFLLSSFSNDLCTRFPTTLLPSLVCYQKRPPPCEVFFFCPILLLPSDFRNLASNALSFLIVCLLRKTMRIRLPVSDSSMGSRNLFHHPLIPPFP